MAVAGARSAAGLRLAFGAGRWGCGSAPTGPLLRVLSGLVGKQSAAAGVAPSFEQTGARGSQARPHLRCASGPGWAVSGALRNDVLSPVAGSTGQVQVSVSAAACVLGAPACCGCSPLDETVGSALPWMGHCSL